MTVSRRDLLAGAAGSAVAPSMARAQDKQAIRIGVLADMNGPYADFSGQGAVIAARLAAEEFGDGMTSPKVEILRPEYASPGRYARARHGTGKIGANYPSLQSLGGRNPRFRSIVISVTLRRAGAERYTERAAEEGPSATPEFLARAALKGFPGLHLRGL